MMMRSGQHNNKRGRGRNRGRHQGGGGGGGGGGHGGNSGNRVYDSNGPDVKVRGTAQTVAEKYMQLGRDAQSAGDTVMAESYYQHAEHYYRLWLANQPAGQPIHFPRRPGLEEEFEEEVAEGAAEGAEGEELVAESADAPEGEAVEGASAEGENFRPQQRQREFRDGDQQRDNRDGGNRRDRFRSRWQQRRGERGPEGNRDEQNGNVAERIEQPVEVQERAPRPVEPRQVEAREGDDNWEAPSFLKRPMPQVRDEEVAAEPAAPRRGRPRRVAVQADLAPAGDGEAE